MKNTFTGKTRLFLCISGAIIVAALILQICGVGMNLGIDFTGGSLLNYSVGENFDTADVEKILTEAGYEGSQITKAAPSDASLALQAELAAGAEEAEEAAEEAVEETSEEAADETEEVVEETAEEAAEETEEATEEAAEEAAEEAPAAESILDMDKSGIKEDGLTDLQLRLRLVDETEGLEDAIAAAVKGIVEGAEMWNYAQLTNSVIVDNGYDSSFAGGYIAEFNAENADAEAVKAAVETALAEEYSVESLNAEAADGALRVFVKTDDQASQIRSLLEEQMVAKYPNFRFVSIDHVSAVAGRDLLSNAVKALLIAFACMLIYIAIRFDVFSGLAALFGLLHDVLVMCAFMVFFRGLFQVNSSFIAAILTIVGYSINNTIIIFDRIRETAKKPGFLQKSRREVVEVSVSQTLSRTINTTLTTMITLVTLYIFGVESIREFAFPLIIGMLAGTYSSVLLSGQVWAMWMDRFAAGKAVKKA